MRAVLTADLDQAARRMAALPPVERATAMATLLARAHAADKYRKATGRAHPLWGPGTLAGTLTGATLLAPPPRRFGPAACAALAAVLAGLDRWRADPARRSRRRA